MYLERSVLMSRFQNWKPNLKLSNIDRVIDKKLEFWTTSLIFPKNVEFLKVFNLVFRSEIYWFWSIYSPLMGRFTVHLKPLFWDLNATLFKFITLCNGSRKKQILMAVQLRGGPIKGLPLRKNFFWDFFLICWKVPTAIKLGGGGKALMALPLIKWYFYAASLNIKQNLPKFKENEKRFISYSNHAHFVNIKLFAANSRIRGRERSIRWTSKDDFSAIKFLPPPP